MATQPAPPAKPQTPSPAPKPPQSPPPQAPKPNPNPNPSTSGSNPASQPKGDNNPHGAGSENQKPHSNPKPDDHDYDRDEAHGAKRHSGPEALRDQRDYLPPGTPYTAPEGHEFRNPGPGEPGGPSAGAAGSMDPPVRTIADEQRARSEDMQAEGMQAWQDQHDERDPDAKPKVVPGVQHRPVEEHEARGSSTPAARSGQNPAAPR